MKPTDFFIIKNDLLKPLFEKENVWEVVKALPNYLKELFSSEKIKGNFASNVFVEDGAKVDPTARILGPAYIGKGVQIRFNAYIRENVIVGENSNIGHASEIKNSIILNNSTIAHFNHIGDSVIGSNINFAGGAQVANLRLDQQSILVDVHGQKIDTQLKKLGAIIGDNCRIGANSVLNPGVILGKNSIVYPLVAVSGTYQENSIIK
ncbi:glucose-1-phosphate thymidylyltransferase [Candidatus Daviesbacteria bacterium]|nr:glucose-1-phosphate thymidylyltransferase [Candidatus Daviesbacteria bacterium]